MNALTPLAVQNADVLRALHSGAHTTVAAVAEAAGRIPNHMARTFKSLESEGLVERADGVGLPILTDTGRAQLEALARAEAPAGPAEANGVRAEGGRQTLIHAQIVPDPHNPRRDFDSAEAVAAIDELAASILAGAGDGPLLLQNLVVRPVPEGEEPFANFIQGPAGKTLRLHQLVAGERRWRAIGRLIERGDLAADWPIDVSIHDLDDAQSARLALIENLKRRDLKPLEEARAFRTLVDGGLKTADLAETINCTQRMVQQRLQLLELSAADQKRLDEGKITLEQARQILANRPKPLELEPRAAVLLVEIYDAAARSQSSQATIARGREDNDLRALADEGLIHGPYESYEGGFPTGIYRVQVGYSAKERLRATFPGIDDARPVLLQALRETWQGDAAADLPEGVYAIDFLNGPFEIPEKVKRQIAAKKAEDAKRQTEAQAQAKQAAQAAQTTYTVALDIESRQRTFTPPDPLDERLPDVASQAGLKLPLAVKPAEESYDAALMDADGAKVMGGNYIYGGKRDPLVEARLRLIALAVNAAAGLKTPAEAALPLHLRPMDREAYLDLAAEIVAAEREISLEQARAEAAAALDAQLLQHGVGYGEGDHDTTQAGCRRFVNNVILADLNDADEDDAGEIDAEDEDEDEEAES